MFGTVVKTPRAQRKLQAAAPIVVEACVRVLENPAATGGTSAPAELFDGSGFLAPLAPHLRIVS